MRSKTIPSQFSATIPYDSGIKGVQMNKQLQGAIMEQLRALTIAEQRRVLEFARALAISEPRGVSGGEMTRFAGTIANDDLALMRNAIEQGCEQVAKAR